MLTREGAEQVYVMTDGRLYKIGRSISPEKRAEKISAGRECRVSVLITLPALNAALAERCLHRAFMGRRMAGEWFDLSAEHVEWIASLGELDAEVLTGLLWLVQSGAQEAEMLSRTRDELAEIGEAHADEGALALEIEGHAPKVGLVRRPSLGDDEPTSIPLAEVVIDGSVYPRERPSSRTIEDYADAYAAGARFPPIVLERGTNVLLDGYHRLKALVRFAEDYDRYARSGRPIPPKPTTVECVYCDVPGGIAKRLFALGFNLKHGLRVTPGERRRAIREQYKLNPGCSAAQIAALLGISERTVRNYLGDLIAQFKDDRDAIIARLSALGWTQMMIAERLSALFPKALGKSQRTVSSVLSEIQQRRILLTQQLAEGHTPETLAPRYNLPTIVVYHYLTAGRSDREVMDVLGIPIQPYDVWHFNDCDDRFGADHPGRIPGQLVAHVLYFFTEQGDLVLDPMAGSGTTVDVCLAMGRRCFAYDLDDRHGRPDILPHDWAQGWPSALADADLIFLDPPYFKKKAPEDVEGSISDLDREGYTSLKAERLREASASVKPGTRLALLMSDWDGEHWEGKPGEGVNLFVWDYAHLVEGAGWRITRHIQCPMPTQLVHPDIVVKFRERKRLARLGRYLLVAVKA